MTEKHTPEDSFDTEFHNLGKNFVGALRAAWDHPERKRMEDEIVKGLSELGATIKNEADSFDASAAGQRIKSDVKDFSERVRSPETYSKVRNELIGILKKANAEMEKIIEKMSPEEESQNGSPSDHEDPTDSADNE